MKTIKELFDTLIEKFDIISKPPNNAAEKYGNAKNLPNDYIELMNITDGIFYC